MIGAAALQFRFLVITLAAVAMVVGILRLREMPVDVLPEYAAPYVEVQTESLGLSADEVESLITHNLEELLHGVPWLQTMRSQSVPGLSSIVLVFEPGTDIYRARQVVQERLTLAHMLPNVSSPPVVLQPLSATSRVMVVGLSSRQVSAIEMSVLSRWKIRPALMGVPGVANVSIWGQRERQLQVRVDPEWLRASGVTLDQVIRTTGDSLWVSPLSFLLSSTPGTGGWIDTPQQRLEVRHVLPIVSPQDLAKVPVYQSNLRLGDVADVVEDHQPLIGDAVRDTGPSLLLVIEKFPGANTVEVTRGLEATLDAMRPGLAGIQIDTTILRPASFIEAAVADLSRALLVGLGLVALALLALLLQLRVVLIGLIAIVLSFIAATLVLHLRGATLNAMTLAGLIVALGVVIDDAVIDGENIARRLRQHRHRSGVHSVAAVVLEASGEMRRPVMFAALITLLAVVPLFLFRGVSGALIQPLALSYALAVAASMVVALTVTPALTVLLLSSGAPAGADAPLTRRLHRGYEAVLARTLRTPRLAYAALVVLLAAGVAAVPFIGIPSLLPAFQERQLLIEWSGTPGTSHPAMTRIAAQATEELRTIPGVTNVGAHVGRALLGDEIVGINSAKIWVSIAPSADYERTLAAVTAVAERYPGLRGQVQGYVDKNLREALAGSSRDMVVRIFGPEWGKLRTTAQQVRDAVARVNGVVDPQVELPVEDPNVQVRVDLAKAQAHGVKPGDVRRAAATLVNGFNVGLLFEDQKIFDVVVWSTPETRDSLTDIRELLIDTPAGGHVRLGDVADIRIAPTLNTITREAVSRYIDVGFDVSGRDLAAVGGDVQQSLGDVSFPLEYHAELLGEYAARQTDQQRIAIAGLIVAIGAFLLLQAAFQSWRLAAMVFFTLPLSLVGGLVAAAVVGGGLLSLGSLVGLLTVLGIAARNGIVLIDRLRRLEEQDDSPSPPPRTPLVTRGATERLAPIAMTTLATALALLPLILFGGIPGQELWRPMAITILGGLITSAVVTLAVLPTLYLLVPPAVPVRVVPEPAIAPASA
jgi:CzcA family heavy metal efflux pump